MRYFDAFAGAGGFLIGIENAYDNRPSAERSKDLSELVSDASERKSNAALCVGFSEIDKYASAVLRYRFPNVKNYGNIETIDWSSVPDFDLLTGGSPCQDFSVAGKRAGLEGNRSGLFHHFIRCLIEKQPKYFIWENVKGVLSSKSGKDFAFILNSLAEAGYSLCWQVLNAKYFGVPQNRERVFVVGIRGEGGREVFFERGDNEEIDGKSKKQPNESFSQSLTSSTGGRHQPMIVDHGQRTGIKTGERIRRLTPIECERLMSWPDDWTKYGTNEKGNKIEISDSQRYKMCGNGVVSRVVKEIVRKFFIEDYVT